MLKLFKVGFALSIFMPYSFLVSKTVLEQKKPESFVLVKKKKTKKVGRKSKESICRSFGSCAQLGAEVVQQVGGIQVLGLEKTAAYLGGDDPFAGIDKNKLKELEQKLKEIENTMLTLNKQCEHCAKCAKELFS